MSTCSRSANRSACAPTSLLSTSRPWSRCGRIPIAIALGQLLRVEAYPSKTPLTSLKGIAEAPEEEAGLPDGVLAIACTGAQPKP